MGVCLAAETPMSPISTTGLPSQAHSRVPPSAVVWSRGDAAAAVGQWLDRFLVTGRARIDSAARVLRAFEDQAPYFSSSTADGARGRCLVTVTAARVTLLDGFSVEVGGSSRQHLREELPLCAQRLVAHLGLSGRPRRSAVAGSLWPD